MESETPTSVMVVDGRAQLVLPGDGVGNPTTIPLASLPEAFVTWQRESRRVLFASLLATTDRVRHFQAHLPVVVTHRQDGDFPFHTANKGMGLLPTAEYLGYYVERFRRLLDGRSTDAWPETLKERIALMDSLYAAPERLDRRCVGSLEIFQGQTFRNILGDPRVSLHYTGDGPEYPSFQVNAVAEIMHPGDLRFEFLYWARQLFERDYFHIQQPAYPLGYVFWASEVFDKTPQGAGGRASVGRRIA